jgi:hypothetical protein
MSSITMKPKWTITRESEEHITHREARSLSNTWEKDKKRRFHLFCCLCLLTQPQWLSPFSTVDNPPFEKAILYIFVDRPISILYAFIGRILVYR